MNDGCYFGELRCFFNNGLKCYKSCDSECPAYFDIMTYEEIAKEKEILENELAAKEKALQKQNTKIMEIYASENFDIWKKVNYEDKRI